MGAAYTFVNLIQHVPAFQLYSDHSTLQTSHPRASGVMGSGNPEHLELSFLFTLD